MANKHVVTTMSDKRWNRKPGNVPASVALVTEIDWRWSLLGNRPSRKLVSRRESKETDHLWFAYQAHLQKKWSPGAAGFQIYSPFRFSVMTCDLSKLSNPNEESGHRITVLFFTIKWRAKQLASHQWLRTEGREDQEMEEKTSNTEQMCGGHLPAWWIVGEITLCVIADKSVQRFAEGVNVSAKNNNTISTARLIRWIFLFFTSASGVFWQIHCTTATMWPGGRIFNKIKYT